MTSYKGQNTVPVEDNGHGRQVIIGPIRSLPCLVTQSVSLTSCSNLIDVAMAANTILVDTVAAVVDISTGSV